MTAASYVIPTPPQASLPVVGETKTFPVRRIWCVGRNYLEHIREMGNDERAPPFFFAKHADMANAHIHGFAVGIDLPRRALQRAARKKERPWEVGKSFDCSAPCSAIQPAAKIGHPSKGKIWLTVNGKETQKG